MTLNDGMDWRIRRKERQRLAHDQLTVAEYVSFTIHDAIDNRRVHIALFPAQNTLGIVVHRCQTRKIDASHASRLSCRGSIVVQVADALRFGIAP